MKFLSKIILLIILFIGLAKFLPLNEIYYGYTHQNQAKQAISDFYGLYNYNSFSKIYDNVLDSETRLKISERNFNRIMKRFKNQKGKFLGPNSKAIFHYKPFLIVKNFVSDFLFYRDENIEENSFYIARKNGRIYYCINFHAKFERGFAQSNFILAKTIDGLKVVTPMKLELLKEYF